MAEIWTCKRDDARCTQETIVQASGARVAIICPTHGVIALRGFKPSTGTAALLLADNAKQPDALLANEVCVIGGRTWVRPPAGNAVLLGVPANIVGGVVTVRDFIDTGSWRGWLENNVWIEEER